MTQTTRSCREIESLASMVPQFAGRAGPAQKQAMVEALIDAGVSRLVIADYIDGVMLHLGNEGDES